MSCCVRTCKKNKSEDTLFHFPVDPGLQSVWVNILKENNVVDPDWDLTEDSQICINHFNNSCCIKTENDVLLTGEAYPSIFEVDDYLIEEIFEDGVDNMITTSYEVLNNGDESTEITEIEDTSTGELNNSTDLLDKHITMLESDFDKAIETKLSADPKKPVSKLKNISTALNPGPKTIDISKRIESAESQQKIPMFKVVPEKPGGDASKISKDGGFKLVPDEPSPSKPVLPVKPSNNTNNKAMQAIQIGNQFYVVSPNTPDGKELSPSQLAAIKEKLVKEMSIKGPALKKQLTIALDSQPQKKQPKIAPKKVTTIDLNKGLPKQLKEIMSDKGHKKRKLEEEAETFTVSSSLDIMPVTPAKKSKSDVMVLGADQRIKTSDFPGNITFGNGNQMLPLLIRNDMTSDEKEPLESKVPNRTLFYKLLQDVNKHIPEMNKNLWSHVYNENQIAITKTALVENGAPIPFVCLVIDVNLQVTMYKNKSQVFQKELSDLNINLNEAISSWVELKGIIDKVNLMKPPAEEQSIDFGVTDPNQYNNFINKTISVCKQVINHGRLGVQEHDQKIVSFICEQLSLLNESKEFRKYSVHLLVFCYITYISSPSLYESLRKVLILPDGSTLKEMASADISRDFVHANEHRMVTLASKINGFAKKDKVVVLQMYNIKVSHSNNVSNVLMFVAAATCKSFAEVIYFCPIQDAVQITRVSTLTFEIIKRLENIGMQVAAFVSEYNELTFALFKSMSQKKEKVNSITHPVDKRRKLFLLYENSSILTAICWDWMSKEHIMFPPLIVAYRTGSVNKINPQKATFQAVANYLKREKVHVYYKHLNVQNISLINQVLNKENVNIDESQKAQFTLNIFQEKLIHAMEGHQNREFNAAGEFMRIIYDWWCIVSANSGKQLLKDKFKLTISEKNKEPIHKLNCISKWVNIWRLQERNKLKLSNAVFHVFSENVLGYKQLSDSLLRDYNVDQFLLGTFQVSLPSDVGFVSSSFVQNCKFNYK
ncbi:hypothetical protein WDU94_007329 [Cyamophila willieti]